MAIAETLQFWWDFIGPIGTATKRSLPAVLVGSTISTLIGASVVLAERRAILSRRLSVYTGASLLLLLFYPRQISQSSLSYLISLIAGIRFNQDIWGLVIISIPASAAISYLLFSTTLMLSDYFRLPATFIKNSSAAPLLRTCVIATIPFRHRVALIVAVVCCSIGFQAAMIGRTSATTMGTQIGRGLQALDMPVAERFIFLSTSIAVLALTLTLVTAFVTFVLWLAAWFALRWPARVYWRWRLPNVRAIKVVIAGTVIATLALSTLLHLFLVLRLSGFSHAVFDYLNLPAGQLEQTLPTLSGAQHLLTDVPDAALAGAFVGAIGGMALWFANVARSGPPVSPKWVLYGPPLLACLAFVPSSFVGSLLLAFPGLGKIMTLALFLWGVFAAVGLTGLLVSHQLLGARIERYANLRRLSGVGRSGWYFFREYSVFGIAVLFAVALGNVFDSGYREQMGLPSLGAHYSSRDIIWPPDQRGLALAIMFVAVLIVWVLASHGARGRDGAEQ